VDKRKIYPWYFAIGALGFYVVLFFLPGIIGVGYSFTDWSSYSSDVHFVGWQNFAEIFSPDREYLSYIGNTLVFTLFTTVVKTVLALLFALLLSKGVKALNFHRAVMYLPTVLSVLVVSLVFTSILDPANGLLNQALHGMGLDVIAQQWLADPNLALWSVMAVDTWRGLGYLMTILIVGILSISPTYYEAADIDGASSWKKFRYVTLPLLRPTLAVVIVLNVLYGLKVFDIIYALTHGGPGHATEVMYTSIFSEFSQGRYAVGTAISSLMFIIMIAVGYFMIKVLTRDEVQE
jgi:raffinose/stachyose/melibiose transport system permease protein